jgi:DNA-directed RNA polymerase omega subunit
MNNAYLERAKAKISDPQILTIVASKRAKQLALGGRPMIKCDSKNHLDVALLEIAEGLLDYEFVSPEEIEADFAAAAAAEAADSAVTEE